MPHIWLNRAKLAWTLETGVMLAMNLPILTTALTKKTEVLLNRLNRIADGAELLGPLPDVIEYSRAGLYKLWEHILYAPTIEGFKLAYEKLKAFFPQQVEILNYIEETYMPIVTEWATCYTNKRLNFGHRTTSPVEVVNRYLKSFIITGNSTVLDAVIQSFNMIDQMKEGHSGGAFTPNLPHQTRIYRPEMAW
jgi:hypothetical protein